MNSRLSVVGAVFCQSPGNQAEGTEFRAKRALETDEQVFKRHLRASEQWQPLECGWLPDAGMLLIVNNEGKFQVNPTDKEREEMNGRILEITYRVNEGTENAEVWLILPGEPMLANPSHADGLDIRCRSGTAKFTVYLFPR